MLFHFLEASFSKAFITVHVCEGYWHEVFLITTNRILKNEPALHTGSQTGQHQETVCVIRPAHRQLESPEPRGLFFRSASFLLFPSLEIIVLEARYFRAAEGCSLNPSIPLLFRGLDKLNPVSHGESRQLPSHRLNWHMWQLNMGPEAIHGRHVARLQSNSNKT